MTSRQVILVDYDGSALLTKLTSRETRFGWSSVRVVRLVTMLLLRLNRVSSRALLRAVTKLLNCLTFWARAFDWGCVRRCRWGVDCLYIGSGIARMGVVCVCAC